MKLLACSRIVVLGVIVAGGAVADATPADNVCVPYANGVPTRFTQPPKWVNWAGSPGDVDTDGAAALEDPRWEGAVGQAFSGNGSARSPLQMRALWSDQGGQFLYMSFVMDIEGLDGTSTETPRDLFLGFRRSAPYDPHTPTDPSDDEYGYIFQFHLTKGSNGSLVEPAYCARPVDSAPLASDGCSEAAKVPKDYWQPFVDLNQATGVCNGAAQHFSPLTGATITTPPFTWMSDKQAVRYWKDVGTNRWAILLRLPLVDPGHPISEGIDRMSTFWYQATVQATAGDFTDVGWWPRKLSTSLCYSSAAGGFIDHKELTNPDNYSRLTEITGATPGCNGGIKIDTSGIGSLADYTGTASALATANLSGATDFKAFRADGVTPVVNTVVAQIQNTSTTSINQPLSARFRLASWGSAFWLPSAGTGKWLDMRGTVPTVAGQQPGICLGSSDPNVADSCTPPVMINPGDKAAFSFQWQLGNSSLGNAEYCKFGLRPPGATAANSFGCTACSCATGTPGVGTNQCDVTTDTGVTSTVGAAAPCVSVNYVHQCMLVELSAPNGAVDFEQQSAWNNMNFAQMSVVAQEALIDARTLPTAPNQTYQDIYLLAMPRNMPSTLPATAQGADFVRQQALARATVLATPYANDLAKLTDAQIIAIAGKLGHPIPGQDQSPQISAKARASDNPIQRLQLVRVVMPANDYDRVGRLLAVASTTQGTASDLTRQAVSTVGPVEAATVVPTLEIYPYYQPNATGHAYLPMTSFTVFLSHEGSFSGINWLIDGADRVGQNIYHLRIPVGFARKIQVRAQAIQAPEVAIGPNMPKWPCGGGCASCGGAANRNCGLVTMVGNGIPGVIAGVLVVRRRRKKPAKQAAATPAP